MFLGSKIEPTTVMPFPFTFKFTNRPKVFLAQEDYPIVFENVRNYLLKKNARDIVVKNNMLEFRMLYDSSNFYMTRPIDSGEITINNKNKVTIIIYEVFFYVSFFVNFVISLAAGIISKSILFGCLIFIIIYSHFLIITFFKHRNRIRKITTGIEDLINEKEFISDSK